MVLQYADMCQMLPVWGRLIGLPMFCNGLTRAEVYSDIPCLGLVHWSAHVLQWFGA